MSSEISTIEESIKIALDAADAATDITSEYNGIKKKNQKLEAEVKKVFLYTTIIFGSSIFAAVVAIIFSSFIYFKSMSDLDVMTTTNREALVIFSQNVDALKETTQEYIQAVKLQEEVKSQNAQIGIAFKEFEVSSKDIIREISELNTETIEKIVDSTKTISNPFIEAISSFETTQNKSYADFFDQLSTSNLELISVLKSGDQTEETIKKLVKSQEQLTNVIEGLKVRNTEIIELVKDNEDLVKYP
jgi:predicted transcriptional regulator